VPGNGQLIIKFLQPPDGAQTLFGELHVSGVSDCVRAHYGNFLLSRFIFLFAALWQCKN